MTAYRHVGKCLAHHRYPINVGYQYYYFLMVIIITFVHLWIIHNGVGLKRDFRSTEKAVSSILHLLSHHISLTGISSTLLIQSFKFCHQTFIPLDLRCHFPNTLGRDIIRGQPFFTLKFYLAGPLSFLIANNTEEIRRTKKRLMLKLGESFSSETQARRRYSEGFPRTVGPLGLEKEERQQRETKK